MAMAHDYTVRVSIPPRSHPDGPATVGLHVRWQHCYRVYQPGDVEMLFPAADEPTGALRSSHFNFRSESLSAFEEQLLISIRSLDFIDSLSNCLYEDLMSFIDFVDQFSRLLSVILIVDINFVHKVYADCIPRSLELVPPRQLAASADENSIPVTTTEGPEVVRRVFENEFIIVRTTMEGGVVNHEESDIFLGNFFRIMLVYEEYNNPGTEILERTERGKSAMGGGGGEANCSICLDELSVGQEVMTMACQHRYHEQCLLTWLHRNQTCPLCRQPL